MASTGTSTGAVAEVTDASFQAEVLGHDKPILVDFWATWCPPCRMIAPVLAEIAKDRADSLAIAKLDADHNPKTMAEYQVTSLPTLLLFRDGEVIHTIVGARAKTKLLQEIDDALRA
ncbi:thioredoxin [Actinokineospora pegani]|uniref:thioredoxin n=1 Tax=Actinokineospora pegani TaxID=2654637 RepID=UPI0012EAC941|nr:thioredoxin [Actinokineospora pegani]